MNDANYTGLAKIQNWTARTRITAENIVRWSNLPSGGIHFTDY